MIVWGKFVVLCTFCTGNLYIVSVLYKTTVGLYLSIYGIIRQMGVIILLCGSEGMFSGFEFEHDDL